MSISFLILIICHAMLSFLMVIDIFKNVRSGLFSRWTSTFILMGIGIFGSAYIIRMEYGESYVQDGKLTFSAIQALLFITFFVVCALPFYILGLKQVFENLYFLVSHFYGGPKSLPAIEKILKEGHVKEALFKVQNYELKYPNNTYVQGLVLRTLLKARHENKALKKISFMLQMNMDEDEKRSLLLKAHGIDPLAAKELSRIHFP